MQLLEAGGLAVSIETIRNRLRTKEYITEGYMDMKADPLCSANAF